MFQRLFVNKNIFNLWTGQVISQAGDSIFEIALLWLLLDLTGSNAITGLVAMAAYLPVLLFGLFSGVLVDRFNRRRLMLLADGVRAGIVVIIPILFWAGGLNALLLGVFTFAIASFNALFNPARDALVNELVQPHERLQANSMIQTSWQFAQFLGPAIAGILLTFLGQVHLFNADAFTFLLSFFFIYQIKYKSKRQVETQAKEKLPIRHLLRQSMADLRLGLRYVTADKRLLTLLLITAADNLFLMGPALIGAPIFVREILQEGPATYAFVQVAYAIGMISGTILLNRYAAHTKTSTIILWGIILDGLTFFPLLWVTSFWGMFITIVIHAMAIPMIIVTRPTIIQNIVPDEMQGRVFSMISVAVYGLTAVSIAGTGLLAELIPINVIYAIIAVLAASTGVVGWFVKDFREMV